MVSEVPPEPALEAPVPTPPGLSTPARAAAENRGRNDHTARLVWALLGIVLVLALFVVFILPYMATSRSDSPPVVQVPVTPAAVVADNSVARNDAQQALQTYLRLRSRPPLDRAAQWGEPQWSASLQAATEGDRLLGRGQYPQARQAYLQAGGLLQELQQNRPQRFAAFVVEADALLAQNQAQAASEQYGLALLMEPGHVEAQRGLDRAQVRDQVLEHMHAGEQAETDGRMDAAASEYRAAIALDADWQPAFDALEKVEAQQAETRFTQALDQALASLDAGRPGEAGEALRRAAQIHPDAPVIADLRKRLATAGKQASLASLRKKSQQYVNAEDWPAAAKLYRKALAIEPRNSFASAGLVQAQDRTRLHQQLDHYLADPLRVYSAQPLANAERLLANNTGVPASEPKLRNKIAKLQALVQSAKQPLEVVLHSDGQTAVTIYHLRRLGAFTEERLSLLPGKYTVVGSRSGYRDVRQVFTVLPGKPVPVVSIRCEEPL